MKQWRANILDRSLEINAKGMTPTVMSLFKDLMMEEIIDFRDLPVEQVNGMHLTVCLRATCCKKECTIGWNEAYYVAKAALERDGLNVEDALSDLEPK